MVCHQDERETSLVRIQMTIEQVLSGPVDEHDVMRLGRDDQRDHQGIEDHIEARVAFLQALDRLRQLPGHGIESIAQIRQFALVIEQGSDTDLVITSLDLVGGLLEFHERPRDLAQGEIANHEQRHHGKPRHDEQGRHKAQIP